MSLAATLRDALEGAGVPPWLVILVLTVSPILEVRASVPVAMLFYDYGWLPAFILAFIGSLLIIPLAYGILIASERLARYSRRLAAILDWLWLRTRRKSLKAERAGHAGLFAIVALPLPGAGTWTACLTAYVLGMPARKALPTIVLGAIVECAILVIVVLFFQGALRYLG